MELVESVLAKSQNYIVLSRPGWGLGYGGGLLRHPRPSQIWTIPILSSPTPKHTFLHSTLSQPSAIYHSTYLHWQWVWLLHDSAGNSTCNSPCWGSLLMSCLKCALGYLYNDPALDHIRIGLWCMDSCISVYRWWCTRFPLYNHIGGKRFTCDPVKCNDLGAIKSLILRFATHPIHIELLQSTSADLLCPGKSNVSVLFAFAQHDSDIQKRRIC